MGDTIHEFKSEDLPKELKEACLAMITLAKMDVDSLVIKVPGKRNLRITLEFVDE